MGDSKITIRRAQKEDMGAVEGLVQELADHQNIHDGPEINFEVLQRDGFESTPPAFKCIVAECSRGEQSAIVGYAAYYPTYSMWKGRTMMLQDICVTAAERRRGIGDMLFNTVAMEATSSGCSRLDFHVLEWNDARAFYDCKGAVNLTSTEQWCYYRLTGDALQEAAKYGQIIKSINP